MVGTGGEGNGGAGAGNGEGVVDAWGEENGAAGVGGGSGSVTWVAKLGATTTPGLRSSVALEVEGPASNWPSSPVTRLTTEVRTALGPAVKEPLKVEG